MKRTPKEMKSAKKLIQKINNFIDQTWKITFWSVLKGIFYFFKLQENKINSIQGVDFYKFKKMGELKFIKNILSKERQSCKHKYKKLHYTYIISRIEDRINEIKFNNGKKSDGMQKLFYILQPGDIMLVNYHTKIYKRNSILHIIINDLLRYFSRSIFVHAGIIGNGNKKIGFEWIHSTLNNGRGAQKLPLKKYLIRQKPCELLVLKYTNISEEKQKKIIYEGIKDVENNISYDIIGAIEDITELNIFKRKKSFNCGELVFDCLKAIDKKINIEKPALPSSYEKSNYFEQIYLTHL